MVKLEDEPFFSERELSFSEIGPSEARVDSPDQGKGKLSRKKKEPESFFISERNLFSPHGCIFSSLDP